MKKFTLLLLLVSLFNFGFSNQDSIQGTATTVQVETVKLTNNILHNIFAKEKEAAADISWLIDYSAMPQLQAEGYTITIKYNTDIGAKRNKKGAKTDTPR